MWFYAINDCCGTCRFNAQRSARSGIHDIIRRVRLYLDSGQIEIRAEFVLQIPILTFPAKQWISENY